LIAMLSDLVVAAIIVGVAAILGLAVNPLLWLVAVLAILWVGSRTPRDASAVSLL
jgi:type IV secretory pathway TrbD component